MQEHPSYSSHNGELTEFHIQGTVIGCAKENGFIAKN